MKTLVCVRFAPYPPVGGAPLRNWQNISAYRTLGPVAVFSCFAGAAAAGAVPGVELWRHVDLRSHFERRKRGRRALRWLREHDARVEALYSAEAAASLSALLDEFTPDVVVFEELWFYRYLRLVERYARTHACRIVLDNHNVETAVLESVHGTRAAARGRWRRLRAVAERLFLARLERDFCRRADLVWVCSDVDAALLARSCALAPDRLQVVPNCIDTAFFEPVRRGSVPPPAACAVPAPTILLAASYGYFPNQHAAMRLVDRILPILRQEVPGVRLLLVGRSPTPVMQRAASRDPAVVVTGTVDDVRPFYAASDVVVVPLEHGSGTRLKILEAFAAGRPVVSTPKGAEGLDVADGVHALIEEDDEALAAAVLRLLRDPGLGRSVVANALALVESRYSFSAAAGRIRALVSP